MDYSKRLFRRLLLSVFFLVIFVIIICWKWNGEISPDIHSMVVVNSTVVICMITTDIQDAWRMVKKQEKFMDYSRILFRRILSLILFWVLFIIIAFWKRNGEISSGIFSLVVVNSLVIFCMITTDIYNTWRMLRQQEKQEEDENKL